MSASLTHAEIEELLGAYALNAVDDDERVAIDAHLPTCPRCRAEVGNHLEVAGMLASAGGRAPEGVWDRIAGSLDERVRAPLDVPAAPGASRDMAAVVSLDARRRVSARVVAALATAAAVLIVALAVGVVRQGDRLDELESALADDSLMRAASLAQADPDAKVARLSSLDGEVAVSAVVLPNGTGYLLGGKVPELASNRTYQLWGLRGDHAVSLGVLGADFEVAPFTVGSPVDQLALTEEVAGGVVQSRNPPRAAGSLA